MFVVQRFSSYNPHWIGNQPDCQAGNLAAILIGLIPLWFFPRGFITYLVGWYSIRFTSAFRNLFLCAVWSQVLSLNRDKASSFIPVVLGLSKRLVSLMPFQRNDCYRLPRKWEVDCRIKSAKLLTTVLRLTTQTMLRSVHVCAPVYICVYELSGAWIVRFL